MKEPSRFLPFLPDFSSFSRFFLIFPLFLPIFWQYFHCQGWHSAPRAPPATPLNGGLKPVQHAKNITQHIMSEPSICDSATAPLEVALTWEENNKRESKQLIETYTK